MTEHNAQPSPRQPVEPAELLRESLQDHSWFLDVREKPGELVVEIRRWSAVILLQIPEKWNGTPSGWNGRARANPVTNRRKEGNDPQVQST